MSALPPNELIPGPQMMSVGFSLAALAFAETREELREHLGKFQEAAEEVRAIFVTLRAACDEFEGAAFETDASQLRLLLDKLIDLERGLFNAKNTLVGLSGKERLKALFNRFGLKGHSSIREFSKELSNEFIPFVRDLRLRTICVIAERARVAGIIVLDVSDDFREAFRKAPLDETKGWQETAYVLANVEAAESLSASIKSASRDRTEEILLAPTDGLPPR